MNINLKITNKCLVGCPYCFTASSENGEHAPQELILKYLDGLPEGTKIILDGGDILEYPDWNLLVWELATRGYLVDVNIHEDSLMEIDTIRKLTFLQSIDKLKGINISGIHRLPPDAESLKNVCRNVILGITPVRVLDKFSRVHIMGYRYKGRAKAVNLNIDTWKDKIYSCKSKLSFDLLAANQLGLPTNPPTKTMYIDVVEGVYYTNYTLAYSKEITNIMEDMKDVGS